MTLDQIIAWDATAGLTTTWNDSIGGTTESSTLTINFGHPGWTGDTSVPGQPDVWCFIDLDVAGLGDSNTDPAWWLGVDAGTTAPGITNCGQDSAPGANDAVPLCGGFFATADPVTEVASQGWDTDLGGAVPASLAAVPGYFYPYGYSGDNFWGGQLNGGLFGGIPIETMGYGWQVDNTMTVLLDPGGLPVRHTDQTAPDGLGGMNSGVYFHQIPWLFSFQP